MLLTARLGISQGFVGITSQQNSGLWSVYQNPALLVNDKYSLRVHAVSGGVHIDNNYVKYAAPFSMVDLMLGRNSRPLSAYDLEEIRNGKPKHGTLAAELRGPAVAFKISPTTHVALMTRVRSGAQVTNASEKLLGVVRLGLANVENYQNLEYLALYASHADNQFNSVTQAYSEWALSLGQVLTESDYYRLMGGVTIKRYFGYAGAYVQNHSLRYRLVPDSSMANAALLQVDRFNADLGYTSVNDMSVLSPSWLLGRNAAGKGWGLDLGMSYDLLGEDDKHVLRLSASVTDIGRITYSDQRARKYTIDSQDKQITASEWANYTTPREGESRLSTVGRVLEEQFGLAETDRTSEFQLATPQALNMSADLRLMRNIYVNTTWIKSMRVTSIPGLRASSLLAVTPRLDADKIGVSLPIIRQNGAWAVGGAARVGAFMIGSDNLLGLFARNGNIKAQGADVYAGISFGIRSEK
ncbi:hypothetical protein GCM10027291_09590 [Telluribacter humicola]